MPKGPVPRDRELRQLFGRLCDQAADVAASSRACRCSEDVRSAETDGRRRVDALRRDLMAIRQRVGAASAGDDLSDEGLKRTLAGLESQVKAKSDEPSENTRTVGTQTEPAIPEPREQPALDGATATPTLMRLPPEVRALIWWEALRPEGGFVTIVPWAAAQRGYVDSNGRIRARGGGFRRSRTALIDRKRNPFADERGPESRGFAYSWMREGEEWGAPWTGGWALLHVSKQVYEEAEAAYWRRVVADGLMLSFGCGIQTGDYWGVAVARTFFNDFTTLYLQHIQRVHLDLRRPDNDDGPNGYGGQAIVLQRAGVQTVNFARNVGAVLNNLSTRLTSLRHLSLTLGGWVPDVRQTPVSGLKCSYSVFLDSTNSYPQWIEDTDYPNARLQSSETWVTRMQNITGLTRLRLRIMYAPRDLETINARLDQDEGVQRTIHFMSMLRGSMLVNGDALGTGNMRAWANKRQLEFTTADRFRIVVQCDDSWDEENNEHLHHVEDDEYDPLGGLNNFTDQFRWDPDADS